MSCRYIVALLHGSPSFKSLQHQSFRLNVLKLTVLNSREQSCGYNYYMHLDYGFYLLAVVHIRVTSILGKYLPW